MLLAFKLGEDATGAAFDAAMVVALGIVAGTGVCATGEVAEGSALIKACKDAVGEAAGTGVLKLAAEDVAAATVVAGGATAAVGVGCGPFRKRLV